MADRDTTSTPVDIDSQGYPIIDKGGGIPPQPALADPPPLSDILMEDDFNRPDSPLSDDARWMDVPTRTGLSVRSNQCQSLLLHRANLSVVVADSNCGMKYTVSEGPESGVFMGLRWSADGQNGYRWNINAGVAALFGLRNGQEASIDGIENVPQEIGDVFEIRASGSSHYLLRNSQLLGKIDDTGGVGPGEVAGHVYLGLLSSMKVDDFSCGNLAQPTLPNPTLSDPTTSNPTPTSMTIGVTTDSADGTLYAAVRTAAQGGAYTEGDQEAIRDATVGGDCVWKGNIVGPTVGANQFEVTGLSTGVEYFYGFAQDAGA